MNECSFTGGDVGIELEGATGVLRNTPFRGVKQPVVNRGGRIQVIDSDITAS